MRAMDLFAGCGGLSLGLQQAGIEVSWANELDPDAAVTFGRCHPDALVFREEAQGLLLRVTERESGLPEPGEVDLLVGGPPCQGFSGYNRHRRPEDPRNSLVETFLDFMVALRPKYALIENVPGLLSMASGDVVKGILQAMEGLGYSTALGVLQAGSYGLPQNRWRVFILAAQAGLRIPGFPAPTHAFHRTTVFGAKKFKDAVVRPPSNEPDLFWRPEPSVSVGDAISDLPPIGNGEGSDEASYEAEPQSEYQQELREGSRCLWDHRTVKLGDLMLRRCQAVPKAAGAGWLDLPEALAPKNLLRHGDRRYDNRFGRLHFQGAFNTILTRPHPYWSAVFHPQQDRVISVRECARAQGFPDRVKIAGTMTARYRQVGNMVPPPLARAIGQMLLSAESGG